MAFGPDVPEALRAAWRDGLEERLREEGWELAPAGADGAAPLGVRVDVESGEGRTHAGTRFRAAAASAGITLHRSSVELRSAPGTTALSADPVPAALSDLLDRVVETLVW